MVKKKSLQGKKTYTPCGMDDRKKKFGGQNPACQFSNI